MTKKMREFTFDYPAEKVFRASITALEIIGFKPSQIDEKKGSIQARSGNSLWANVATIVVQIFAVKPDKSQLEITSIRGGLADPFGHHEKTLNGFSRALRNVFEELDTAKPTRRRSNRQKHSTFEYLPEDQKFRPWTTAVLEHLEHKLVNEIEQRREKFVNYWPCWVTQTTERTSTTDGTSYTHLDGWYGAGYICITSASLYIVVLWQLSQQYSLKSGLGARALLGILGRTFDDRKPYTQGNTWRLPLGGISGLTRSQGNLRVTALAQTWDIIPLFSNTGSELTEAVQAAVNSYEASSNKPTTDVANILKQLAELRDKQIITSEEFEKKKRELLNRL